MMRSLLALDPGSYVPHRLHDPERDYAETNCYADLLIELLAASGREPMAALGACVAVDFELDQWTFFKPPTEDLRRLYGIEIHEMQPYRSLPDQIAMRIDAGQVLIPELDAYWLPDTATTSYRQEHVKTSVVAEAIDLDAGVMRYFHNAGYYELSGEDYRQVFRLTGDGRPEPDGQLPPYVDLVRFDAGPPAPDLRAAAAELLAQHLGRRPADNPFDRFAAALHDELPALLEGDLAQFHAYAFANARMAGSAFELLATHVRWLLGDAGTPAAAELDTIVATTKALLFRLARRRSFEVAGVVGPMAESWSRAIDLLVAAVGCDLP